MNNITMKITQKALFCFVLAIIVIYLLFPFYWALNSSFKTEAQLQMMPATFIPRDPVSGNISFSLINYKSITQNQEFLYGLINSSIVAISTTLLALVAGSFAGFAIGKLRFRGKQPSMYIILAMTMFPQITVLTGLFAIINTLKLEPRFSMILTYMIFTLPFTTWVLAVFFKSLPTAILESSQVDGATFFQTFYRILLPLTAPALVTTGLLAFIASWNEYLFALTFTTIKPAARTVPVAIAFFTGYIALQEPFGEIMAAAVVVTVPIVVLVLIFQRRIIRGLTAGSVKG